MFEVVTGVIIGTVLGILKVVSKSEEEKRQSELLCKYKKDLEEKREMKFFDEKGNELPNPWKKGRVSKKARWWKIDSFGKEDDSFGCPPDWLLPT